MSWSNGVGKKHRYAARRDRGTSADMYVAFTNRSYSLDTAAT